MSDASRAHLPLRLIERARRKAKINRAAGLVAKPRPLVRLAFAVALHVVESPTHDDRQLVDESRLEGGEAILCEAYQRRSDRLVRASLRRQRSARRSADDHEARILVTGIIQRIEPARDERVVERADGEQALAEERMRKAERREQDEQVHLGDAEFHVLARRTEIPLEGRGNALGLEQILHLLAGEEPALVDPRAEIGRHRDVGRRGDDAIGERFAGFGEFVEDQPEALLGRHDRLIRRRQLCRHGNFRRLIATRPARIERHGAEKALEFRFRQIETFEPVPFVSRTDLRGGPVALHLGRRQQPCVIVLVAGKRQAEALDRIGDEHRRAIMVDRFRRPPEGSADHGRRDWT